MSYRLKEKLGEGAFGNIYRLEDKDGNDIAYKVIEAKNLNYIELDIMSRLFSPYLIRTVDPKILDYNGIKGLTRTVKEETLKNLDTKSLPYIQLKRIIISSIYGLRCMHRKGFLHLDVSSSNILYDRDNEENYTAYLSDFGWSARCNNAYQGIISTKVLRYKLTPLEILEGETISGYENKVRKYSDKSDIWNMGMVILELLGVTLENYNSEKHIKSIKNIDDIS